MLELNHHELALIELRREHAGLTRPQSRELELLREKVAKLESRQVPCFICQGKGHRDFHGDNVECGRCAGTGEEP